MSDSDRRTTIRREGDDLKKQLSVLRDDLLSLQFLREQQHKDNGERFGTIEGLLADGAARMDHIDGRIANVERTINEHVSDETSSMRDLHECLDRNVLMLDSAIAGVNANIALLKSDIRMEIADMKDNFLPLLILDAGKKTWWLATVARKSAEWMWPIVMVLLTIGALILWWLGKGPFPHP